MKRYILFVPLLFVLWNCSQSPVSQKKPDTSYQLPKLEDIVIYQVNPRLFTEDRTFRAVGFYLDSIKQLGANIVWFMPIHEIGKEKSVNSPYCVRDYKSVNSEFGTMDEFKQLIAQCHEKELGVIIDWVPNHTSWDHPWIENKSWYTQNEQGEIIWPEGTGWSDVADLDYDNPEMRLAMIEAMKYWVTEIGIDGFRVDAVDYVPADFLKQANDSLLSIPDTRLLLLAEGKRPDHFASGYQLNYGWDFAQAMRRVYTRGQKASTIFEANEKEYSQIPAGKHKLRFSTNHDEAAGKSPVQEWNGERGSVSAFVISTFMPGCPMIYSSQEVGYPEKINFFYPTPVNWSMNNPLRKEYERIISIYNSNEALRKGDMNTHPDDNILLFERSGNGKNYMVAINVRDEQQTMTLPATLLTKSYTNLYTGKANRFAEQITLNPYEYLIAEIQ